MGNSFLWNGGDGSFDDPDNWTNETDPFNPPTTGISAPGPSDYAIFDSDGMPSGAGDVAYLEVDADAEVVLDGASSADVAASNVVIGVLGTGSLSVVDGATVAAAQVTAYTQFVDLGYVEGAQGFLAINGAGSRFLLSNEGLDVGVAGTGTVTLSGAGELLIAPTASGSFIGEDPGSSGEIIIADRGSSLVDDGNLVVGDSGNGSLSIEDGGEMNLSSQLNVGSQPGGNGTIVIDGKNSQLADSVSDTPATPLSVAIGDEGQGTLIIRDGGTADFEATIGIGVLDVGREEIGDGTVIIDGEQSLLTETATDTNYNGIEVGVGGSGTLTIQNGGEVISDSGLLIGFQLYASGSVSVAGRNSLLLLNAGSQYAAAYVGNSGLGTLTVSDQGQVVSNGLLVVGGQAAAGTDNPGDLLSVSTAAVLTVSGATLGGAAQATGSITVDGVNSTFNSSGDVTLGNYGTGEVSVSDYATASITGSEILGQQYGSYGSVSIDDATATVSDILTVGESGSAILSITDGGSETVRALIVSGQTIADDPVGAITQVRGNGSTLTVTANAAIGNADAPDAVVVSADGYLSVGSILSMITPASSTSGQRTTLIISTGGGVEVGGNGGLTENSLQVDSNGVVSGSGLINSDVVGSVPVGDGSTTTPTYSLSVKDDGNIEASGGTLTIQGNVTGSGMLVVDPNSALELAGQVAAGIAVNFESGGPGTLVLDDPADFSGTIDNITVGDQIILPNINPPIANTPASANGNAAATLGQLNGQETLQFVDKSSSTSVVTVTNISLTNSTATSLSGDYIQVSSNGAIGTTLTVATGNPIALAVGAPAARAANTIDGNEISGAGVTIGIISDSFNFLGGASADIAAGALTQTVDVIGPDGKGEDEGRAMAQIIDDIAPGSTIDFCSGNLGGPNTPNAVVVENITNAIGSLQRAGCQIIVDDLGFANPPYPDEKAIDNAIDNAFTLGVTYITAAGNTTLAVPIHGHEADANALTVAAMNLLAIPPDISVVGGYISPTTENFSAVGEANSGKPDITGPDGGPTTFGLTSPHTGLSPFLGTSAAAAAIAGVAALMMQENPQIKTQPSKIYGDLEKSAYNFGEPYDEMGTGLVQAVQAVAAAAAYAACYLTGTLIRITDGEAPVEHLCVGDCVITLSGEARPIVWIGKRSYASSFAAGNPNTLPIQIRRGALSDNVPRRDLFVSPQHAMFIDGLLIPASALVNGTSMLPAQNLTTIEYYHIELASHDIILAEGAPSETFVDDNSRNIFENADQYRRLYPTARPVATCYCAPRVEDGYELEAIRLRLERKISDGSSVKEDRRRGNLKGCLDRVTREQISGWAFNMDSPDTPVRLLVLDRGLAIGEAVARYYRADLEEAGIGTGWHSFDLTIPGGLSPMLPHSIEVRCAETGQALQNSPWVLERDPTTPVTLSPLTTQCGRFCAGALDEVTRSRISGWAHDDREPGKPVSLLVLDNGSIVARVLANCYRSDLEQAGIGRGRHSFDINFPINLSPRVRHVIEVRRERDGAQISNSPKIIEAAGNFDPDLEEVLANAIAALGDTRERERALRFLVTQVNLLLEQNAAEDADRSERLAYRKLCRRWGPQAERVLPSANSRLRALVLDEFVPDVERDAESQLILWHMRRMLTLGYAVTFVAANNVPSTSAAIDALIACGISYCGEPFYASVEEVLCRQWGCFDLVYLLRQNIAARYGALVRHYYGNARVILGFAGERCSQSA
jgi:T5SS/PEP-CTERM-associated repeat protein